MNLSKIITIVLILLISSNIIAQTNVKIRIIDSKTNLPVPHCEVTIYGFYGDLDTTLYTYDNGIIEFNTDMSYDINIERKGYNSISKTICTDSIYSDTVFRIDPYDYDNFKIADIAEEDFFDLNFGFDVYSPVLIDSENKFKSVFSFYYAYEFKSKLAKRLQLGIRYEPLKVKWMQMNSDTLITKIPHAKERYFQASTSLDIYFRYIFSLHGNHNRRGLFLDLGAGYTLPYYFSYTYFTEDNLKTTRNKIHNFKDFSAMARLGYYWGSIKATYRLSDITKDDYIQPPKLTIGIEFNIPAEY